MPTPTKPMVRPSHSDRWILCKLFFFSAIGIIFFFLSVNIGGKKTILLDHVTSFIIIELRPMALVCIMLLMAYGTLMPLITGQFKQSISQCVFTLFKALGLVLAVLYLSKAAPEWAMRKDILPFLFEKLALPVGLLIPIGAIALTFLIGFGLLEFVSVFMERLMRPLFRTPGASAIDAVASFVGSYSIGLLITDKVYQKGHYSHREAVIIATGFSTVSATFMIIVAKTLGMMPFWNFYFWSTFVITFVVTAITAYLPPIRSLDNTASHPMPEPPKTGKWAHAKQLGVEQYLKNTSISQLIWVNFKDGLRMSSVVAPSILAIGFTGLIMSKYTPIFDIIGVIFKPFLWLTGFEGLSQYSGQLASGLAEMFLPAILLADVELPMRYMVSVTVIGSVLFFSGSIPCILATSIPVKIWQLISIWFIRTILCLLLASLSCRLGLYMGWLV